MSFEVTNTKHLESEAQYSTTQEPMCKEDDFSTQTVIDFETHTETQAPDKLAKNCEASCSSQTLFAPQITSIHQNVPIRHIASSLGFCLPRDRVSDKQHELEIKKQHYSQQEPSCEEGCLPAQTPINLETHTGEQVPDPSAKPCEASCSSQIQFEPRNTSIHQNKPMYHIASNLNIGNHSVPNPVTYNLVQQIIQTIGELESTLLDDQQNDFNLRMAYELQTAKLKDLCQSLEKEKGRNVRLMELIRGADASSTVDEEELDIAISRTGATERWSRSSDAYESISPLLMQQRYDELSSSYKQCRKQLIKKEKLLKLSKCETETAKARYDNLLDEYKTALMRIEHICLKYLQLQSRKNLEIQRLSDSLNCASECIGNAQQLIDYLDEESITLYVKRNNGNFCEVQGNNSDRSTEANETNYITAFKQNLELFVKSLRLCQWVQHTNKNNIPKNN